MLRHAARLLLQRGAGGANAAAWRAPPRWPTAAGARPACATASVDGSAQTNARQGEASTSEGGAAGGDDGGARPRVRPAELAAVFTCNVCGA